MTTNVHAFSPHATVPVATTPQERLSRGGGWWTLILTLIMLSSMAGALKAAAWSEGLEVVQAAIMGGALLGFLLALTRWDGFFPVFYSFLTSIAWITTVIGRGLLSDLSQHDRILELVQRNIVWLNALLSHAPSADNLIFVTQLCFLGWWIGYLAIWSLIRHQKVLHAIVPTGIALLVNIYYAPGKLTGYLIIYLITVLMIAIRIELARNEARWQLAKMRYPPDIFLDFLRGGLIFAAIVIILAWTMPSLTKAENMQKLLHPFEGPWHTVENTWSRMYKSLNYRGEAPVVTAFGKSLTLGGPIKLTDRPIFEAETPKRTYWRAAVFDFYTGRKWLNTDQEVITRERNEPLGEPPFYASREITATIHPLQDRQEVVFTPPHPLRITLPIIADVSKVPRSDDGEGLVTVSLIRSRLTLTRRSSYQVAAAISLATPDELRAAPAVYPAWIAKRYLQLPDTLPTRIVQMAREITAPYTNPYDKASALEARLREYTYNEKIAAPPEGWDGVDYFLFDVKAGYCNYYASALAVMLRAVGIPTRFIVGYTPGQSVPPPDGKSTTTDTYQVQERDAHAWTEVWFPTYGWIQFEPTASEPLLVRPTANPTATPETAPLFGDNINELKDLRPERGNLGPSPTPTAPSNPVEWIRTNWVGSVLGIIGMLAIGMWLWLRRRRLAFFRDPELAVRLFGLLETWARRLHVPWPAGDTPLEHAAAFNRILPEAQPTVGHLTALFVAQRYGRQRPSAEALADTMEGWEQLQPLFWRRWLGRLLSRLRRLLPLQ